jgi:hypothetical protein
VEHEDLFLFKLENNPIVLPSKCEKDFEPNPFNYNDVSERNLIIKIYLKTEMLQRIM